jgi:hypothetical protein
LGHAAFASLRVTHVRGYFFGAMALFQMSFEIFQPPPSLV